MKVLIFDSGPLINFSMNGLLYTLKELKKGFDGKFIITEQVKQEIIDKPLNIQKFELGALKIQSLLDSGVLEMPESLGISYQAIADETRKLMNSANHSIRIRSVPINIVSEAEMSCLAVSTILNEKKIDNIIVIDERTTRVLGENPENLERLMSSKLHHEVKIDLANLKDFENHKFIRSSELAYVVYKKGLVKLEGKRVLEALIYATKFKGTSISFEEINELKKM